MSRNRSLDEFVSGDDNDDESDAEDSIGSEPEGAKPDDDPGGVEPIASTYRWSPGGAACSACGAVVEERWRDGDGLVCAECKDW